MSARRYLPTFADLVDRLCICQLKAIYIPENKAEYEREMADIIHDINLVGGNHQEGECLRAVLILAIANLTIWMNESKARAGGAEQDKLLKFTHSINGVRAKAKNILSRSVGERVDLKADCLAADMPVEFGNWNIFDIGACQSQPGDESCSTQGFKP